MAGTKAGTATRQRSRVGAEPLVRAGRAALRIARRVLDLVPVTPLGVLVAGLGALALREVAMREMDYVLAVACAAVLGMVVVAILLVVLGALRIKLASRGQRGPAERTLETGRSLPTGFALPGLLIVPLLQVRWEWEAPEAEVEIQRKGLRLFEDATLRERGVVTGIARRIVIQDAFGLARVAVRHRDPGVLKVMPHAGMLRDLPLLVSMAGGDETPHPMGLEDGDRVELRRYAPGDPARFIHWKVFSRTRKLMVRMPERALSRARRTVAYLASGPGDEASAGAARIAVESGALGPEWTFGADGTDGEASEVGEAIEKVIRSARASGGSGLRSFLDRAERTGPASLVLFAPPRRGEWLDRALVALRGRPGRARVVIGVDGIDTEARPTWWERLIAREAPRAGTPGEELDAVLAALAPLRCDVVVIDRRSGRRLGAAHLRAAAVDAAAARRAA